ncbi:hypothetical protein B0H19DRAFT_1099549 [Mycena capillaripes]|nr:hypothetical protein B0H19DRAFT_1099549 [Mycena capillaripes]
MPLLSFVCFSSRNIESSSVLDFEVCTGPPRQHAKEPPLLGSTETNLFDTFPRVGFGGYRRYYESRVDFEAAKSADIDRSRPFELSHSSIVEDPWSWSSLPEFTGTKRRRVRKTNSYLRNTFPRLRKKPRFHSSARPLVDTTYASPNWLSPDSESNSDSPTKPPDLLLFNGLDGGSTADHFLHQSSTPIHDYFAIYRRTSAFV